jgi:hypothetical protein
MRAAAPGVMLSRVSGPINSLLACGAVRCDEDDDAIALVLSSSEAAQGGMATISMRVAVWCPDCAARVLPATGCRRCGETRMVQELFSAWLAIKPGAAEGDMLAPSVELPGMVNPLRFRVHIATVREHT